MSSLVTDKIRLEKDTKGLDEKIHALERKNLQLMEENGGLHSDINSLIQVRECGHDCMGMYTHTITQKEEILCVFR